MPDRPRLLILGATGRLGGTLAAHFVRSYEILAPGRQILDLNRPESVAQALNDLDFDFAINAAAVTSPDVCEDDPALAMRVNAESSGVVANVCASRGVRFIHVSTDYVFAGNGCVFLDEKAPAQPVNAYGRSKREGEKAVLKACPEALVARVSWLFGPQGGGVPETAIQRAREGLPLGFIEDKWSVPTSTVDIARWLERLLVELASVSGLLHLCNAGVATWRDYAQVSLDLAHQHGLVGRCHATHGLRLRDFPQFKAARPPFTVMNNARLSFLLGETPRSWQSVLEEHIVSLIVKPSA
ncbi:SDR family oxidoreductase [Prosthecobacter fusiformis]|nr:sugar nucleotide-binding protein [Prosthecobacter fusiformis]